MNMQSTGMPGASFIARPQAPPPPPPNMMSQMTGSMMGQPMGAPPMMQHQAAGISPMMPQTTSMSSMMQQRPTGMTPMMGQPTGMPPMMGQPTGMTPMMSQPTGISPMMSQSTGIPMAAQMTGAFSDPRMRLMYTQFLPAAQPYSGVPVPSNMNFHQASLQPDQFQNKLQTISTQQPNKAKTGIPWTMSKDERKSYDNIFRAWDAKKTGWINGDVARELFGQSGLSREQLLQIWHLADAENRGKLNIAEFHIAMALIYRALNGNEIPQELPAELVPSSSRDLSESVDFLKDLLKQDTNVRNATALNLTEPGSNKDAKYTETRSFYKNPVERDAGRTSDAVAYKHRESDSAGYRSRSRYLDRREVQFNGQSAAEDLGEMKRKLEKTQRMLERTDLNEEEDHDLQNEMEDVRYAIRRLQDDIEYYNRREGPHAGEQRRKAERTLMQLLHERLPQLERRLDKRHTMDSKKELEASRLRDARNNDKYSHLEMSSSPVPPSSTAEQPRSEPSDTVKPVSPVPPSTPMPAPSAPKLSGTEREAWIRSEAQRRVQERMRMLGVAGTVDKSPSVDASVEQRLASEKSEAEARTAQAEQEAKAREEARKARLREHKQPPPPPTRARLPDPAKDHKKEQPLSSHDSAPVPQETTMPSEKGQSVSYLPKHDSIQVPERKATLESVPDPPPLTPSNPLSEPEPEPNSMPTPSARAKPSTNPFFRQAPEVLPSDLKTDPPPLTAAFHPPREPEPKSMAEEEPMSSHAPVQTPQPPQPHRPTPPATAPTRSVHLPPSHDDDWDEEEDEDEDENPLSSRTTRQHLAQQLFSGVVPTTQPATSVPPPPPIPPAPSSAPIEPEVKKGAQAPSAEAVTSSNGLPAPLGGNGGDRNALLSQIRGGTTLKKTTTRDRSGALTAGSVLGSSSPPAGISTSSVPVVDSSDDEPESAEPMSVYGKSVEPEVDTAQSTAVDPESTISLQNVTATEPGAEMMEESHMDFDTNRQLRCRTLYAFAGGEGMASFEENSVLLIHPKLNGVPIEGDWTYGSLASLPEVKGLIPTAYVALLDSVVAAEALYDYEASSPEEATIHEGELLQVVDQSDENWWLILRNEKCLLVPSNYVAVA